MKIKEIDNKITINKTLEDRKKDVMNWFTIAIQMNIRFLKKYKEENKFNEYIECEKQIASFCEKFRRTCGAIKNEELKGVIKEEINNFFKNINV